MAQEIDRIINLLEEIKALNTVNGNTNTQRFENVENKWSMLKERKFSSFLKAYNDLIGKTLENKISVTSQKLELIEETLKSIRKTQKDSPSDVLSVNIQSFYEFGKSAASDLKKVKSNFSFMNNRQVNIKLSEISSNYTNRLVDVISDLNTIVSDLQNYDWRKHKLTFKKQISILTSCLLEIKDTFSESDITEYSLASILSNVITGEKLKLTFGAICAVIDKTEDIREYLENSGKNYESESVDLNYFQGKINDISNQTKNTREILGKIAQNINLIPDTTDLEKSVGLIYGNLENLYNELNRFKVNNVSIISKITSLNEDFSTVKTIISDLCSAASSKIEESLNKISFIPEVGNIKQHIAKIVSSPMKKEDIFSILNIEDSEIQNSEPQETVDKLNVSDFDQNKEEFNNIYPQQTSDIKNWFSDSGVSEDPSKQTEESAFVEEYKSIPSRTELEQDHIRENLISLSDYIDNNLKHSEAKIQNDILELRELLNNRLSGFSDNTSNGIRKDIENYFNEVKSLLSTSSDEVTIQKLSEIEEKLSDVQVFSKEQFDIITRKLFECEDTIDKPQISGENLSSSTSEILSLKSQIEDLAKSFAGLTLNGESDGNVSKFISDKLSELASNLEELNENIQNGIQQGFTYNSELIEEKSSALLSVIKELRHASTDNIELFERLTVTDNKLIDIKQELELVNTDVTSGMNSISSSLLEKLEEIKSILQNSSAPQSNDELKDLVQKIKELKDGSQDSNADDTYENIIKKLDDTHNSIRDFVLGDIDSVIIKVDNLREYITDKIESIVPPNPKEMKELNKFVSQIADFKKNNTDFFSKMETTINENIDSSREEIKSMLSVALNNKEILSAIENLKEIFTSRIEDLDIQDLDDSDEPEIVEENSEYFQKISDSIKSDFNKFADQIDELSGQNADIENILNSINDKIDDLKVLKNEDQSKSIVGENNFDFVKAFDLLSKDIKRLKILADKSGQGLVNPPKEWLAEIKSYLIDEDIRSLIEDINQKVDILVVSSDPEKTDNTEVKRLLDVLNSKVDILAANDNYGEIEELADSLHEKIDTLSQNSTIEIDNSQIISMLETLNKKIDIISQSDNSEQIESLSDSDMQITSMLETLNKKIDIIAQSDNSEQIADLSDSDMQITSMLETLNHKIDIIAESGQDENLEDIKNLILEQKDYIDKLEPNAKLDTFKKCLTELASEVNNPGEIQKTLKDMKESIMDAVVTIFNQVSFVEETEDIKDFVEEKTDKIAKELEEVTRQIKQIAAADNSEEYTYSMQDIETDLAKLRLALNELQNNAIESQSDELTNITDTLNRITYSVDALTQDEIQDLKTDITNLKEQTKQLLLSSDASFSTLNNDIAYKVDNVTQLLEKSNDSDKVMRQALIYMGEWIDSASESMNRISTNSDEIINIKNTIEELKDELPEHGEILSSIDEKFDEQQEHLNYVEKQISKIENLEARFEQQEERIDRLEANLDKILSVVEDIDSSGLMRKVDKIDKQLAKLSSNIEKLASYVD